MRDWVLAYGGWTEEQMMDRLHLSQTQWDHLSKENWQAIVDRIRTADRQEFEAASKHPTERGVSIAGLLEIPPWFLRLSPIKKIIASPILLFYLSYELLHMFFVGFYQKPMAYEWFQAGGIHIRDPQRLEDVVALAFPVRPPQSSKEKLQGLLWSDPGYFFAKTVLLRARSSLLRQADCIWRCFMPPLSMS